MTMTSPAPVPAPTPPVPEVKPPEQRIRGWKGILAAVCAAIGEPISMSTVQRWASHGSEHRLPVQGFRGARGVFLLPSHLKLWAETRTLPHGAMLPGAATTPRPFTRIKPTPSSTTPDNAEQPPTTVHDAK